MTFRGSLSLIALFVACGAVLDQAMSRPVPVAAELWCADPLRVHEWGVHTFSADGAPTSSTPLPSWFFRQPPPPSQASSRPAARDLPPDHGERAIPVVQFYGPTNHTQPIPLGIEVSFAHGDATAWYPQVDSFRTGAETRTSAAIAAHHALVQARATAASAHPPLGVDPTSQLEWASLTLTAAPSVRPLTASEPWVTGLRAATGAYWVNQQGSSERFVFYEGRTTERVAISIERGDRFSPTSRHYVLRNTSAAPLHDVFVVRREGANVFVYFAATIPPGVTTGFVLERERVVPARLAAATRERMRARFVDSAEPAPVDRRSWIGPGDTCVMQRNPAIPVEHASGHALYRQDVDAMLALWGARFFDATGTTIVYREDTAVLDREIPLAVTTDMFRDPVIRRLGLAVWENVALP